MWVVTYNEGAYGGRNCSEFETKEEAINFIRVELVSGDYNSLRLYQHVPVEIAVTL